MIAEFPNGKEGDKPHERLQQMADWSESVLLFCQNELGLTASQTMIVTAVVMRSLAQDTDEGLLIARRVFFDIDTLMRR